MQYVTRVREHPGYGTVTLVSAGDLERSLSVNLG
jgi:hypothetical protein